ncbi:MAG TPA: amino acid ABC transporter permease [Actinomycetota bacterium]|nr:amino acid ABC transporter permease [Actinomycetota bacterium]
MSAEAQAAGAGDVRLPPAHLQEPPSAKYLLIGSWVLATEGALALVFLPVLVFTTRTPIPPADIAAFGVVGIVCLVGAGLLYVRRSWTWWLALAAAIGAAAYLVAVGGLTSSREGVIASVFSGIAAILLILGRPAAGDVDAMSLASARIPFRLKVTLVWLAIFFILGIFLALSDLDFGFIRENLRYIAGGLKYTILLAAAAIILATILALFGALGRLSKNPVAYGVSGFYTSFFRGTPLIVQLFLIYLALPQLGTNMERLSVTKFLTLSTFVAGVIGLGFNYGAYMTEIFRAGIQSVSHGQAEAADALGMNYPQRMRRVVLPQATRVIIPPTGNEFIAMMKDTALVGLLGVTLSKTELFMRAQLAFSQNLTKRLETLLVAAALYWVLTSIFTFFQARLERRLSKGYTRTSVTGAFGGRRTQYLPGAAGGGQGGGAMMVEMPLPDGERGEAPSSERQEPVP